MMMRRSDKFWDRIAKRYAEQPIADEESYKKKLAITREYLAPEMEVLEIGCGTGSTAIAHAAYVKHILATDISSKMIEIARAKAEADNVNNVTFRQAGVEDLGLPDQSLDAVLALSILHLLENRDEAIAKVHRLLKPGGVFVSSTACLGGTMRILKCVLPIGRFLGLLPLVRFFTEKELRASMINAGFEIEHQWQPGKGKAVFIIAKKSRM